MDSSNVALSSTGSTRSSRVGNIEVLLFLIIDKHPKKKKKKKKTGLEIKKRAQVLSNRSTLLIELYLVMSGQVSPCDVCGANII